MDWPRLVRAATPGAAVDFVLPALPLHLGAPSVTVPELSRPVGNVRVEPERDPVQARLEEVTE